MTESYPILLLQFQIESYWQAGSGRGGGALIDSLAHKDAKGLPYLPGRTVKGLLRDAVYRLEQWGHTPNHLTHCLFGSVGVEEGITRMQTNPGALRISDASLPENERIWLAQDNDIGAELRSALYQQISTTAIEYKSGTAKFGSLRSVEVVVPLKLEAQIEITKPSQLEGNPEITNKWLDYLKLALPLIRAIGTSRSRGLGRVKVGIRE